MGKAQYLLEVKLGASTAASYNKNINRALKSLDGLESTAKHVAAGAAAAFAAVNVSQLAEDALSTYSEFEQAMRNTAAIANATVSEYEMLERAAREAGRSTTKTATESAEALGYMALAGWSAEESVEGLMPILKLSEATGAELKETSDLVTDSMSALGLSVDDMGKYLDEPVAGNNNANMTAVMLMESLIGTGGASRALGASLEDTITAVGILANNGTKASKAGTAMNSIFTRLATNSKAQDALAEIGADIFDAEGNFIGLRESIIKIDEALKGMSTEERTGYLKNIAGTHYFSQMEYLLDSARDGANGAASAWDTLESEIENSNGALDKMNTQSTDTMSASWERLKSAVDDAKISIVDVFGDDVTDLLDHVAEKIPGITDEVTDFVSNNKAAIYNALETGGELLENVWNIAKTSATWLLDHEGAVTGALTAIGSALLIKKGVNTAVSIVTFLTSLTTPMGVIAGLAGAAGVIAGVGAAIRQANEEAVRANLDEHFGNISLSLEELQEIAGEIVHGENLNMVAEMLDAVGESESALKDVERSLKAIEKSSWKIRAGFTFDEQDAEQYETQIDDYVQQAQEYIEAKDYEINVAAALLFGTDSDQAIETSKYADDLRGQVEGLGRFIRQQMVVALQDDGIIDEAEDQLIQHYVQSLNNITTAISESQQEARMQAIQLKYDGAGLDEETFLQLEEEIARAVEESQDAALAAYESAMTVYNAKRKTDPSYTTFKEDAREAELAYFEQKANAVTNGAGYILESIQSVYPELESGIAQAQDKVAEIMRQTFTGEGKEAILQGNSVNWESIINELYNSVSLDDSAARGAIEKLHAQLEPLKNQMEQIAQEYIAAGEQIPKSVEEGLQSINLLGALSGNENSVWGLLGDAVASNESYKGILDTARERGANIPDQISGAIADNSSNVESAIEGLYAHSSQYLDQVYAKGFDVDTEVRVNYKTTTVEPPSIYDSIGTYTNPAYVTPHAEGGIFSTPHFGLLAEDGPEAYIPLDGSQNALSIWEQAGEMLGVGQTRDETLLAGVAGKGAATGANNGVNIQILFNPHISIQGTATQKEVREAVAMGADDVINIIKEYVGKQARVSFKR